MAYSDITRGADDRAIDLASFALAGQRNQLAASSNFVQANGETIGNPGAGPTSYIYQLLLLTARYSGFFVVGWGVPFNSGTTADTITMAMTTKGWTAANWATITTTGKHVLTGATAVGVTGAGVGAAINSGTAPGAYQAAMAGTTITNTTTGAASTTSTQDSMAYGTLTGLLTANGMQRYSGSALVHVNVGAGAKAPFAIGSPVAINFLVTATNTITMTGSASFWAVEMLAT